MAYQQRGKGWEFSNTLFMLFFLVPLCFPWPFIIMAGRVESKKYKRLGYTYFILSTILTVCWLFGVEAGGVWSETFAVMTFIGLIMLHLFALMQCAIMKGEYLRLLAEREDRLQMGLTMINSQNMYNGYGMPMQGVPMNAQPTLPQNVMPQNMNGAPMQQPYPMTGQGMPQGAPVGLTKQPQMMSHNGMQGMNGASGAMLNGIQNSAANSVQGAMMNGIQGAAANVSQGVRGNMQAMGQGRLNINTCTENELASLPGLNIVDAKKAIAHREQHGSFGSIEELVVLLNLKPHVAAPLYEILYCEGALPQSPASQNASNSSGRRTLDI